MAKKVKPNPLTDIFAKTEQGPGEELEGKNTPVGVYLTRAQRTRLNKIAGETGVTLHALLKFALARFLSDYDAGRIELKTDTKKTLRMPI